MRYRRGEVNSDRRPHHLPEAEQRGSSTCLLAERGESLCGTERIDDAHAEQEHRHGREERQEGRVKDRYQQDRDAAESLIADDFLFTSPQDDHIDRAAFFERCFPTAGRVRR